MMKRMRHRLGSINDLPPYRPSEKDIGPPDAEPGLPAIHRVQGTQSKAKSFPQMREATMGSLNILDSIDRAIGREALLEDMQHDLQEMTRIATSAHRFDNQEQFKQYLTEGALLNINSFASQLIGVPEGEYLIYNLGPDKTILVPTRTMQETDFRHKPKAFEVFTPVLTGSWSRFEILTEAGMPGELGEPGEPGEPDPDDVEQLPPKQPYGRKEQLAISVARSKWPRDRQAKGAAEASGKSQKEISDAASAIAGEHVSEPDVSRALAAADTPSSRMPELHRAAAIAAACGGTIEQVFGNKIGHTAHK